MPGKMTWEQFLDKKNTIDQEDAVQYYNDTQSLAKALNHYADYMANDPKYGMDRERALELNECSFALMRLLTFSPGETNEEEIRQAKKDFEQLGKLGSLLMTECSNGFNAFMHIGRLYNSDDPDDIGTVSKQMRKNVLGNLMNLEAYYGFGIDYPSLCPVDDEFDVDRDIEGPRDVVYNEEYGTGIDYDIYIMEAGKAQYEAGVSPEYKKVNINFVDNNNIFQNANNNVDQDYLMALQMQQEEYGDNANIGGADQIGVPAQQNHIGVPTQQNQEPVHQAAHAAQGLRPQGYDAKESMLDRLLPNAQAGNQMDAPTKRMVLNIWTNEEDNELNALKDMFKTRTRRLYINSSEYRRANRALDAYVRARSELRSVLVGLQAEYLQPENAAGRMSNADIRDSLVDAVNRFRQSETELKNAMQNYVVKKTGDQPDEVGNKQIYDMRHGYGAARLAAAKGLLEHLNSLRGVAAKEKSMDEEYLHSAETSFRKLYNEKYGQIRNESDRRKRSSNHALREVKRRHFNHEGFDDPRQNPPVM